MGGGPSEEHLLVTLPFPEPTVLLEKLKKEHPYLKITYKVPNTDNVWAADQGLPDELWQDVTILVTLRALPPKPSLAPKLELIHFLSAGSNHVAEHPIYTDSTIPLTTSSGIHGPQISEYVVLTLLASSHNYDLLRSFQKSHTWAEKVNHPSLNSMRDRVGLRFGVLGYGSIGRQTARVAKAMGMDVIAYTASPRSTPESKQDKGYIVPGTGDPDGSIPSAWYSGLDKKSLHNFLAQDIDVLLVSVPLTPQTTRFLSTEEFAILGKRKAFVTNISRGQIIDQDALIAALNEGAEKEGTNGLGGCALDVTDPEPLPKDNPLWDTPNCIVTPHISGLGRNYAERSFEILDINLRKRENGERLINVVDREKGY